MKHTIFMVRLNQVNLIDLHMHMHMRLVGGGKYFLTRWLQIIQKLCGNDNLHALNSRFEGFL